MLGSEDYEVTVGKNGEIMMGANDSDIASGTSGGGKRGIQLRRSHLPDDLAGEIDFLKNRIIAIGARLNSN